MTAPPLNDDAGLRRARDAAEEGDRCRDQQRAGCGQHEDLREPDGVARQSPGRSGDGERDRREGDRESVGQAHHRSARFLRGTHEGDDLLILAVGAAPESAHADRPRSVDGTREHGLAGGTRDRHALAGQRRLVEARLLRQEGAVHRNDLGRPHEKLVADGDLVGGKVPGLVTGARTAHVRDLWCAIQQRRQLACRATARVVFERLAPGEHEHDDQRRDRLADSEGRDHRDDGEHVESDMTAHHVADHADDRPHDDGGDVGGGDPRRPRAQTRAGECRGDDAHGDGRGDHGVPSEGGEDAAHAPSILLVPRARQ
ncbi:hypothetical protein AS96_12670 [Microbacterium sp. MRS-1]|nr:hypothetical protein AS96_12670 [Microbacterium sp. MRS-1]